MQVIRALVIGLLILPGVAASAERESAETELWGEFSLRAKLSSRSSATLTENLRWSESASQLKLAAPELLLRYRVLSWWRLEGGGRYMHALDNDEVLQARQRIFAATRFRARTGPLAFELRLRWRKEFRREMDDGTPRREFLRTRAKLKLRAWRKITPYVSLEIFHRMDGDDADVPARTHAKTRYFIGAELGRGDVEFDLRYGLEVPIHEDTEPVQHIVSFGVRFEMP